MVDGSNKIGKKVRWMLILMTEAKIKECHMVDMKDM